VRKITSEVLSALQGWKTWLRIPEAEFVTDPQQGGEREIQPNRGHRRNGGPEQSCHFQERLRTPEDYADTFSGSWKENGGSLMRDFTGALIHNGRRFRNRLVHIYWGYRRCRDLPDYSNQLQGYQEILKELENFWRYRGDVERKKEAAGHDMNPTTPLLFLEPTGRVELPDQPITNQFYGKMGKGGKSVTYRFIYFYQTDKVDKTAQKRPKSRKILPDFTRKLDP